MKVSVVLITYNHEKHVKRAIESVLMQQTDFDYELLISEDCSTDRTREILYEFQRKYPDQIHLLLSPHNLCTNEVFTRAIAVARGDFIATLDGDDYWTSPHKLQRQVDFLSQHSECSMCFHNVFRVWEDDHSAPRPYHEEPFEPITGLSDILRGNYVPSCSAMIRRNILTRLPAWYANATFGDWPLYIVAAQHGSIGYLDEIMAVYRIHRGGFWSGLTELDQIKSRIVFYKQLEASEKTLQQDIQPVTARVADDLRQLMIRQAGRREWKMILRSAGLLVRYFPREVTRACRSAFVPSYRPYLYRRYPAPHRLLRKLRQVVKPRSYLAAEFEGNHEVANSTMITGWAWDRARPNQAVNVAIWDGDKQLAVVPADRFRGDLVMAGKGDGYHAFVYWTPNALRDGAAHCIRATIAESEWSLPGSPIRMNASNPERVAVRVAPRNEYTRVLLAYPFCGLGGVETAMLNRSEALRSQGIEPTVLFGRFYGTGASAFANLPYVHVGLSADATAELLEQGFDAIVIIDYPDLLDLAESYARGSVILLESHISVAARLSNLCRVAGRRSVTGIVVPSRFNERLLKDVCGECRPIHVIPNAVNAELFAPQSTAVLRARFGALAEKTVILWIGRLEDMKDPAGFLTLAHKLRDQCHNLHFIMVGDAPEDPGYQERLRRLLTDDAQGDFTFTPAVPYGEMPYLYALAAATGGCLVSTSRFESVPMIFLEAMACECPVIATDVGGVAEIVEDGVTGALFQAGDHERAVQAIRKVLPTVGEKGHREKIVRAARARVTANHSIEAIGEQFLRLLRTVGHGETFDSSNLTAASGDVVTPQIEAVAPNF